MATVSSPIELPRRPEAITVSVESLVDRVVRGRLRVPVFQRALKWGSEDVLHLFDSIYRGYPIGSLLLNKQAAPAKTLRVGPLDVKAPELGDALWIVDGQQRVVALAASLARPEPIPDKPTDSYVVYFNVLDQTFCAPKGRGRIPESWVPLPRLLDAAELSEWAFVWPLGRDAGLRSLLFQAGKRIREYAVPAYVVETDDEELLKTIFYRINNLGKRLEWTEVHDALFGGGTKSPGSLKELGAELALLGMGTLGDDLLLQCVVSFRGLDVTRNLKDHVGRNPDLLKGGVVEALPAIRGALSFLREYGDVPHVRLLPRTAALIILTRFFALHPNPLARTMVLLRRFVWRNELTVKSAGALDERTLLRRAIEAVNAKDEQASVQALLALVSTQPPDLFLFDAPFDARSQASRMTLLSLARLGPRHLVTGELLDVAGLVEEHGAAAFVSVFPSKGARDGGCPNRIIHPPEEDVLARLRAATEHGDPVVLRSHAISADAAVALWSETVFLDARRADLEACVRNFTRRLAEWGRSDRPTIDYILRDGGDES